jgi:hypothetical protein
MMPRSGGEVDVLDQARFAPVLAQVEHTRFFAIRQSVTIGKNPRERGGKEFWPD